MKNSIKRTAPFFTLFLAVILCGFTMYHDKNALPETETANLNQNNSQEDEIFMVDQYVIEARDYLNAIRQNPSAYSSALGVDLSYVEPRQPLQLNQYLIKAAQEKANYMASQDFFAHVDPEGKGMNVRIKAAGYDIPEGWCEDPSKNFFESIGVGATLSTSKDVINLLVIDSGVPSLGHRKHLLGIDDFYSNCTDMGIGHAYNPDSRYKHYWCVLVAKHNF